MYPLDALKIRCQELPSLEPALDGHYKSRQNAVHKCFQAALNQGYSVLAVQDGGQCLSSRAAAVTFMKYGGSENCLGDGKGGPMANQVYTIKLGCICTKLVNEEGFGNCNKRFLPLGNRTVCYVSMPSNCPDLFSSETIPGRKLSAQACPENRG